MDADNRSQHPRVLDSTGSVDRAASGSHWRWTLNGIEGLGLKVEPEFTERMEFTHQEQIVFAHDPPDGANERASVEGVYDFVPVGTDSTELKVDLTLAVNLPLPRLSRPAVESIMHTSMRLTGQRLRLESLHTTRSRSR